MTHNVQLSLRVRLACVTSLRRWVSQWVRLCNCCCPDIHQTTEHTQCITVIQMACKFVHIMVTNWGRSTVKAFQSLLLPIHLTLSVHLSMLTFLSSSGYLFITQFLPTFGHLATSVHPTISTSYLWHVCPYLWPSLFSCIWWIHVHLFINPSLCPSINPFYPSLPWLAVPPLLSPLAVFQFTCHDFSSEGHNFFFSNRL